MVDLLQKHQGMHEYLCSTSQGDERMSLPPIYAYFLGTGAGLGLLFLVIANLWKAWETRKMKEELIAIRAYLRSRFGET